MPLDELICHCLLVFEETEENLENEKKEASKKNVKKRKALRMHLNELNNLILYFHKCLQTYLNRRKDIFIMLGEEETDGVAIQEFNQEYFNDEEVSPLVLEHLDSNNTDKNNHTHQHLISVLTNNEIFSPIPGKGNNALRTHPLNQSTQSF